jgi:hypothetical protein
LGFGILAGALFFFDEQLAPEQLTGYRVVHGSNA